MFSVVALIALLGCEKPLASEEYKFKLLYEKSKAFIASEIVKDLGFYEDTYEGVYAPPYDFSAVESVHEFCRENLWTKDIDLRMNPIFYDEVYNLATGNSLGILSRWRDAIRLPALNSNFSGYARGVASPTSTGESIYPKLQSELIESAYYKKSTKWFEESVSESSALMGTKSNFFENSASAEYAIYKDQNQETKEKINATAYFMLCFPADLIMGVHGKPSMTSTALKQIHRDVSRKAFSEVGNMLKELAE